MVHAIVARINAVHAKVAPPLADVFFDSLGIALPEINAVMAASTEMVGGSRFDI